MRLSQFIRSEIETILVQWDRFARSNAPSGSDLGATVLRNHAREMLLAVADDIEAARTVEEPMRGSEDRADGDADGAPSPAFIHGAQRHRHEFSLVQLGAEFRALRATVLRMWLPQVDTMSEATVREVIRFNEAIDQALAESLASYTDATAHARDLLLAVLGHDLRSPLASMALAGDLLGREGIAEAQHAALVQTVQRSAKLMKGMVDDLLGYTRVQLGAGLPVRAVWCEIAEVLEAAIADARATHPRVRYELRMEGDLAACYDGARLHQLFVNLLVNAAQHGANDHPVRVEAVATDAHTRVRITNHGRPIPDAALESIFKPLVQLAPGEASDTPRTSLGLGLFIAREIAESHGGTLEVTSDATQGTTFTVQLPRELGCRS